VTKAIGLHVLAQTIGQSNYGIYVEDFGLNDAIHVAGGKSYFGGSVGIGAAPSNAARLTVKSGVATGLGGNVANWLASDNHQLAYIFEGGNLATFFILADSGGSDFTTFRTDGGTNVIGGALKLPAIKSNTGTRTLCVDNAGNVSAVAGACSGT
jgi:hypothetical protein